MSQAEEQERFVDEGVQIRGEHMMRDSPPDDYVFGSLWVGHADGCMEHLIEFKESGGNDIKTKGRVELQREEIPKAIEALAERAYDRDREEILERVHNACKPDEDDVVVTFSEVSSA